MFSLTPNTIASSARSPSVRSEVQCRRQVKRTTPIGLGKLSLHTPVVGQRHLRATRTKSASFIRASSLNTRCSAASEGQTQTITRESSTITVAPIQGKEKSPDLDDGGSGLPPRDDGDGGGGGGGGGGWGGGFFFFGFLGLIGFMQDNEDENK